MSQTESSSMQWLSSVSCSKSYLNPLSVIKSLCSGVNERVISVGCHIISFHGYLSSLQLWMISLDSALSVSLDTRHLRLFLACAIFCLLVHLFRGDVWLVSAFITYISPVWLMIIPYYII